MQPHTKLNKPISRLMREGSCIVSQYTEHYFNHDNNKVIAACAIGAASIASVGNVELNPGSTNYANLIETAGNIKGYLDTKFAINPNSNKEDTIGNIIIYLNDCIKWPVEKIADWLEKEGY